MGRIRHLYHLIFVTKGRKMTIPTTGKGLMLERMTRIFTGKGCRVHAANAFLNHVHVLVEIPNSGDFSKIVNKVKGATGTVYQKTPEYADFSGCRIRLVQRVVQRPSPAQTAHRGAAYNPSGDLVRGRIRTTA